jgi:hypothetical protein
VISDTTASRLSVTIGAAPSPGHWIVHDARETVLAHLQRFLIQPQRG